jgi:hypothetical protein
MSSQKTKFILKQGQERIPMARSRSHVKILKTIKDKYIEILWKTGVATKEQLTEYYNIKRERLKKRCHSRYLEL